MPRVNDLLTVARKLDRWLTAANYRFADIATALSINTAPLCDKARANIAYVMPVARLAPIC